MIELSVVVHPLPGRRVEVTEAALAAFRPRLPAGYKALAPALEREKALVVARFAIERDEAAMPAIKATAALDKAFRQCAILARFKLERLELRGVS